MSTQSEFGAVRAVERNDTTSIRYTVRGPAAGHTWVLIHGWGCRRADFTALAANLPEDHRVIAVALPGHGDSRSTREVWSMTEFARDVAAVTDAEGVGHATVVGHSMGGAVAVEFARLRPAVAERVIGIDTFHYLSLYPPVAETAARRLLDEFAADFPAGVRGLVDMGSVPGADPGFTEEIFAKMAGIPESVGIPALEGILRWDMDEALAAVSAPVSTLAVRGLLDPSAVDRYGDRIEFVVHELGGHHFHLEAPEQTAELLLAVPSSDRDA
ncbi:alpha/beta fold hydrolase [Sciscionella sediminilitoris]|uniref:alpha/beta fold hydrolase n=1 Tax=Sciscionella sediminilitoris TaxID=1445613 RepID=UPI0004DF357B|nr:alpha/beta fold hydrolase [Sciscionella sp. SE31]